MTGEGVSSTALVPRGLGMRAARTVFGRECVRFLRQPNRIGAAVGTPVMIWAFMAAGFSQPVNSAGDGSDPTYATYLLPGMMTLVAMFTAIFSAISIIEDRNEGWLRGALVSPAPRWALALGKVAGGSTLAFAQAGALLFALVLLDVRPGAAGIGIVLAALALSAVAITSVGVAFAWQRDSIQGFHAVMNLVLMPAWLLSGAVFAPQDGPEWLRWVMAVNPLHWSQQAMLGGLESRVDAVHFLLLTAFAVVSFGWAVVLMARPTRRVTF